MSRRGRSWGDRRQPSARRPQPRADLRGRFILAAQALEAAERLLPTYRGPDGDHEGIVFLAGREFGKFTILMSAVAPNARHSRGGVFCDPTDISAVQFAAREMGLGLLCQVHSHPGACTEHSAGDDELVLMPFEGMLSIVVPHFACFGMRPVENLGVHQLQDGRWVAVDPGSAREGITLARGEVDLR